MRFKDKHGACGVIYEFQDDGMVAGLKDLSQPLKAMGCGEETHEPVENLEVVPEAAGLKVGQTVYLKSDGPDVTGEIFMFMVGVWGPFTNLLRARQLPWLSASPSLSEGAPTALAQRLALAQCIHALRLSPLQLDGPMVLAGLKPGEKLKNMGTPDETHEPCENLAPVA